MAHTVQQQLTGRIHLAARGLFRAAMIGLSLCPSVLRGQTIRGTAVDATGAPVSGVVVLLVDHRDSVAARALTNETGVFRVVASAAGTYRLRTMRIGFRPTMSAGIALGPGQEITQQLMLPNVPFSLDTLRVTDRNPCRSPSDSAAAVFAIWEQVRTALTATQLTAGTRAISATFVHYQRALDPDRNRVLRQSSAISTDLTRGLWTSPSADSLRRGGYIVSNLDGTTTYMAPDLNVLLSDAFVADHCLKLAGSRDPRLVGIAFEPARDRRGIAGIRGTLWLDRQSSELRRMEFRYTNASREQQYGNAGGHMEFARAKNGAWVISGWNIRMPVLEQRLVRASQAGGTIPETRVAEIRVEGGELALVRRNQDTLWMRTPLVLSGTLLDSLSGARLAASRVSLRGTSLEGVSDASGRFRIVDVLPGEYTVEVRTPSLAAIGATHVVSLTFTDSTITPTIRVPTAQQVASATCPGSRDAMIAGTVRTRGDSVAPRNVKVVAEWNEVTTSGKRFGGVEARTDARGAFRLCGLPPGTEITLRTQTDSASAEPVSVRIPATERFASVELVLDNDLVRGAALSGVVLTDVNGQPIADVEVAIPELSRNVFTNERGAFRLNDIPAGTRTVVARKIGYKELTTTIAFAATQTVERSLMLSRVATLDTVVVAARELAEFEENRKLGLGKFLTRSDVEKFAGQPIASRVRELSGAGVVRGRGGQGWIVSSRGRTTAGDLWCPVAGEGATNDSGAKCGCYAQVYLDKALMNPPVTWRRQGLITRPTPPFDVNSIPSAMIEAIEWYSGPAQTPVKYSGRGSTCGVLVIHTRRGK